MQNRFNSHLNAEDNFAIHRAIRKYGKNHFYVEKICDCSSQEELNEKEVYYIKEFNSIAPNGYNLTTGGDKCEFSEEVLHRLSVIHKEHWLDEEYRNKQAISRKGKHREKLIEGYNKMRADSQRWEAYINKIKSPENRKLISIRTIENTPRGNRHFASKPCICIETGKTYSCCRDAARDLGLRKESSDKINLVCRGIRKHCGGYTFKYV